MEETNSPSVAHVGYDISPLSRVKFKILTTRPTACGLSFKFNSLEWRNIVITPFSNSCFIFNLSLAHVLFLTLIMCTRLIFFCIWCQRTLSE